MAFFKRKKSGPVPVWLPNRQIHNKLSSKESEFTILSLQMWLELTLVSSVLMHVRVWNLPVTDSANLLGIILLVNLGNHDKLVVRIFCTTVLSPHYQGIQLLQLWLDSITSLSNTKEILCFPGSGDLVSHETGSGSKRAAHILSIRLHKGINFVKLELYRLSS